MESGQDDLLAMLQPYTVEKKEAYPVSSSMNNVRNNGPECVERVGQFSCVGKRILSTISWVGPLHLLFLFIAKLPRGLKRETR